MPLSIVKTACACVAVAAILISSGCKSEEEQKAEMQRMIQDEVQRQVQSEVSRIVPGEVASQLSGQIAEHKRRLEAAMAAEEAAKKAPPVKPGAKPPVTAPKPR